MTELHPVRHKNKTLAALLAFLLGGIGAQRLYLGGLRDRGLWAHLAALPLSAAATMFWPQADNFYHLLPIMVSGLIGCLECLIIGLSSDEKWDARHNPASGRSSDSQWPLAIILVGAMMLGAGSLIATMARLFDLLYTGGAYG